MRFTSLIVALSLVLAFTGLAATTRSKAPVKKAQVKKAAVSRAKPKAAAAKSSKTRRKAVSRRRQVTWRNRQQQPTPDRYREIQQALVEKGYLKSEPTGVWGDDSVAAMKRFQNDQKLNPTGKLTAASLIGLGLGAKSAGAPEAPPLPGAPGEQTPPGAVSAPPATP